MEMYRTYREACDIFEGISPDLVYSIREEISGKVITGTKMELVHQIVRDCIDYGDNVSHVPASYYYQGEDPSDEYVGAWAIIDCAYAF